MKSLFKDRVVSDLSSDKFLDNTWFHVIHLLSILNVVSSSYCEPENVNLGFMYQKNQELTCSQHACRVQDNNRISW